MSRIITSSVPCLVLQHFSTLSHKRCDFRKKKVTERKIVFRFSLQRLSETFLNQRRLQRDTALNVRTSSSKVTLILVRFCGSASVVDIATTYGLDGPGIESRWGARFSVPVQTGPGAHQVSCTMGTGSFPGVKSGPERNADPSPPSSAVVIKAYSYTSTPPMGRTACTEPWCLYKGALYFFFNL